MPPGEFRASGRPPFRVGRIAALMAGEPSIRDVIALGKTTAAQCLLTDAPSPIADEQLGELHLENSKED